MTARAAARLANIRHELFAQQLAKGTAPVEAYCAIYRKPIGPSIPPAARRLRARHDIKRRVEQIRSVGARMAGVDGDRIETEVIKIAFSDIRQAFDAGGLLVVGDLPSEIAACVAWVELKEESGVPRITGMGLHNKPRALGILLVYLQEYDKVFPGKIVPITDDMSAAEALRAYEDTLRAPPPTRRRPSFLR